MSRGAYQEWLDRFDPPPPPDWRDPGAYEWLEPYLSASDQWEPEPALAWEFLRRNETYRAEWRGQLHMFLEAGDRRDSNHDFAIRSNHLLGDDEFQAELQARNLVEFSQSDTHTFFEKHPFRLRWDPGLVFRDRWRIRRFCCPYLTAAELDGAGKVFASTPSTVLAGPQSWGMIEARSWTPWDLLVRVNLAAPWAGQRDEIEQEYNRLRDEHSADLEGTYKRKRPPRDFDAVERLRLLDAHLAGAPDSEAEIKLFPLTEDDDPDEPRDTATALKNARTKALELTRCEPRGYLRLLPF